MDWWGCWYKGVIIVGEGEEGQYKYELALDNMMRVGSASVAVGRLEGDADFLVFCIFAPWCGYGRFTSVLPALSS